MRFLLSMTVAVLVSGAALAADTTYKLTGENTTVTFVGTKPDGKHEGGFKKVTGAATETSEGWKLEVEFDVASLYSDNDKLTDHLKNPDFFNVKEFPTAKFSSTKIEKADKGITITGKLTLCGKEKEISFPAEVMHGDTLTLKSEFKINRTDFGMTYGKGKIDEEVALKVQINAKK
ncbi:MAG: YceI family protein [Gemmataceae bacterium]